MLPMPACYNVGDVVHFPFSTYDSDRASVTITGLAVTDIEVYRLSDDTLRSSDNGYTLWDTDGIDYKGHVGIHGFKIDTGDNSHGSFWSDGTSYLVIVDAITVDGQTVRFSYLLLLGYSLRPTTAGRTLGVDANGRTDVGFLAGSAIQQAGGYPRARNEYDSTITTPGDNMGLSDGAITTAKIAASALDGKGDWNTVTPDAAGVAPTAAEVVNEWESQSQADPTGFHVNVKELDGSAIQQASGNVKAVSGDGSNLMRRKDSQR